MSTPESESPKNGEVVTDSSGSILIVADGPGDTTRRPRRPNIPRGLPEREPPIPPAVSEQGPPEPPA
jgi:hypothetical protein